MTTESDAPKALKPLTPEDVIRAIYSGDDRVAAMALACYVHEQIQLALERLRNG